MSMHEALRPLRGIVDWLKGPQDEEINAPELSSPIDDARGIMLLAQRVGVVDRQSPTWAGVASWAANEIIFAQAQLEITEGERSAALRARCKAMRDLLQIGQRAPEPKVEPEGGLSYF